MVILLNGSFGIGKTTVARLLRQRIQGSAICDPEKVGYVLRRLPNWVPLRGRETGDYQDMPAWRAWTLAGIRATCLIRRTVSSAARRNAVPCMPDTSLVNIPSANRSAEVIVADIASRLASN